MMASRVGVFRADWGQFRSTYLRDEELQFFPGKDEMEKFRAWAASHHLVVQFEIGSENFSSSIQAVVLQPKMPHPIPKPGALFGLLAAAH